MSAQWVRLCLVLWVVGSGCGMPVASEPQNAAQNESAEASHESLTVDTKAPGRTPTHFSVSDTGSAQFRIPLWSPPGIGQVKLELGLVYDSRGGNGPFGMGWSLTGPSVISRCVATVASNGAARAVTMTSSDRYCLDGAQLKLKSGTWGAAGSTYGTEVDTFVNVEAVGQSGSGPASFTMRAKDGLTYRYGVASNTAPTGATGTTYRSWMLAEVEDRSGNKLALTWLTSTGETPRVQKIEYPKTAAGAGPFYRVTFNYETRTDTMQGYLAGGALAQTTRVSSIDVATLPEATLIKRYTLTYQYGSATGRSVLTAVQECDGQSVCLEPTRITYEPGQTGFTTTAFSGAADKVGCGPIAADLNGDGRTDLLWAPYSTNTTLDCSWRVRFSTGTGYGTDVVLGAVSSSSLGQVVVGNFLGNSRTQIIVPIPTFLFFLLPEFFVFDYDPATNTFTKKSLGLYPGSDVNSDQFLQTAADYDGDGLTDLVYEENLHVNEVPDTTGRVLVRLNTTAVGATTATFSSAQAVYSTTDVVGESSVSLNAGHVYRQGNFGVGDMNGDGMADLLVRSRDITDSTWCHYKYSVLLATGRSGTLAGAAALARQDEYGLNNCWDGPMVLPPLQLLDWNGDGSLDLLVNKTVILSDSRVWLFSKTATLPSTVSYSKDSQPLPVDLNGDGKTDLLYRDGNSLKVVRSTGVGADEPVSLGLTVSSGPVSLYALDQDGDGHVDLGVSTSGSTSQSIPRVHRHVAPGDGAPLADVATTFVDGYGLAHSVRYQSLAKGSSYLRSGGAVYPEQDFQGPLYVVSQATQSFGSPAATVYSQNFAYSGARVDVRGRGFEGFFSKTTTDSRGPPTVVENFAQAFPFTGLRTSKADVVLQEGGENGPDQIAVGEWTAVPASKVTGGTGFETRVFPYVSVTETTAHELASKGYVVVSKEKAELTYDDFGNPATTTVTKTDLDSTKPASPFNGLSWKQTTTRTYSTSTADWCLTMPKTLTVVSEAPGQITQTRTTTYDPDLTKCRVKKQVEEPNTLALMTTREFGFDACGNVNSLKVTGHNADGSEMPARVTSQNFGTRCQLPETSTNALNQSSGVVYNYSFGVPATRTDENGLVTTYTQDTFGRTTTITQPDQTFSKRVLTSCQGTADCLGGAVYRSSVNDEFYDKKGVLISEQWKDLDVFDKTVRERSKHVLGTDAVDSQVTYDAWGRVSRLHRPFAGTEANGYTQFEYDLFGRPTAEKLYRGTGTLERTTTRAYLGRTTQATDALGQVVTSVTDVRGLIRSVTDPSPGGTTAYEYNAQGALNKTIDAAKVVSTSSQNVLGFTTSSADGNRGATTFTVDSLGQTRGWVDAKGQATKLEYDALGRKVKQTAPEGTSTWVWGTSATERNIGKLTSMGGGGTTESFTYDALGRLSKHTVVTDETNTFDYAYNDSGFLDTLTYPAIAQLPSAGRFALKYAYSQGQLFRLADATTTTPQTLWELKEANAARRITLQTLGRATPVSVRNTFSPFTNELTGIQAGVSGSTTNRQNLAYSWYPTGDLEFRQDAVRGLLEEFWYDPLNRLTSSKLNGTTNLTVTYDAVGNIQTRSDVGTYVYGDSAHPHAVTKAGTVSYAYDANGNVSSKAGSTQTWASFDLPTELRAGTASSTFQYGPNHQRFKQTSVSAEGTETTTFVGGLLERVSPATGTAQWRHLVPTPGGNALIVNRTSVGTQTTVVLTDHLGSTDVTLDGDTGAVIVQESFNAFGARRKGSTWSGAPTSTELGSIAASTRRGFTGHDQLDAVGLIHMGGRVYDPTIGRFLSPDPLFVVGVSQTLNSYSYVRNRPLSLTDPTGHLDDEFYYEDYDDGAYYFDGEDFEGDTYNDVLGSESFWQAYDEARRMYGQGYATCQRPSSNLPVDAMGGSAGRDPVLVWDETVRNSWLLSGIGDAIGRYTLLFPLAYGLETGNWRPLGEQIRDNLESDVPGLPLGPAAALTERVVAPVVPRLADEVVERSVTAARSAAAEADLAIARAAQSAAEATAPRTMAVQFTDMSGQKYVLLAPHYGYDNGVNVIGEVQVGIATANGLVAVDSMTSVRVLDDFFSTMANQGIFYRPRP